MGIFAIFNRKKKEQNPKVYELGQVGTNPDTKLIKKDNDLFIQQKGFMGKTEEVPIKKQEEKTGEIKNDEE